MPTPALPPLKPSRLRTARHGSIRDRLIGLSSLCGLCSLLLSSLAGCAVQPPRPWEKGVLAKPEMTMAGDALDQKFTQHVYGSKEAAVGGYGVGGGGCGCN